jgi:ketosteroid isomerase-like protein
MKRLLLLSIAVLPLTFSAAFEASSLESTRSEVKVKSKGVKPAVRDKFKAVRKAIEAWYAQNTEAFKRKDVAAVMALRTDDFHTVLPDGTRNTRADMQAYTERFLRRIEQWVSLDFQIGAIDVQDKFGDAKGKFASADVTQKTVRMQRLSDGELHKVESGAVQRETWKKTAEGWKLYRVDNIRDSGLYIDGNLVRRPQ